jgi:hypothetical protein
LAKRRALHHRIRRQFFEAKSLTAAADGWALVCCICDVPALTNAPGPFADILLILAAAIDKSVQGGHTSRLWSNQA